MATVAVTCIKNGRSDKFGTSLVAGAKYTIDFDLALSLWNGGFISVSDPSIFNPTKSPYWAQQGVSRSLSFDTGYSGKLLASLTAASTATRVGLVVTVSSTAHGIPSGNYLGADVFFPGCPSLPADWYNQFAYASDNSFTFSLPIGTPGADFAGESVNGGAAYTTQTRVVSRTIPAGTLKNGVSGKFVFFKECGTTATAKRTFAYIDSDSVGKFTGTTAASGTSKFTFWCDGTKVRAMPFNTDVNSAAAFGTVTKDFNSPIVIAIEASVGAAGDYIYIPAGAYVQITNLSEAS